jgi:hypothetical protein
MTGSRPSPSRQGRRGRTDRTSGERRHVELPKQLEEVRRRLLRDERDVRRMSAALTGRGRT